MKLPMPFRMIDCYVGETLTRHVNCAFSPERGFFEPITNIAFESIGLNVMDWHYSPVALWPGAKVFHRKRGSEYLITGIIAGTAINALDGEIVNMLLRNEFGTVLCEDVMAQVSTVSHSPEWAIYKNDEGMHFTRPLSEFTGDRFKILYNGA